MKKRYQAISALAGSGKTYQLTSRFIGLLSMGVAPEAILAITFTRKAAGEIFDRVVNRLAAAILRKDGRDELCRSLRDFRGDDQYQLKSGDPVQWLRTVLNAMPQLHISTIDSLFVSIVQAYALELGLPPRQEILEGGAFDAAREEALRSALEKARKDPDARRGFLEAFKHATAEEDKNVRRVILELANSSHKLLLQYPDEQAWGRRSRIWPAGTWWDIASAMTRNDLEARVEEFRSRHVAASSDKRYAKAWTSFLDKLIGGDFAEALQPTFIQSLVRQLDHLRQGNAEVLYYDKRFVLSGRDAEDAALFLAFIANSEITSGLLETSGCYRLMRAYENAYESTVRSLGRLSFEDVQLALARARESGLKMDIDYRLDGQFDHWMLDEFQDTSARQWSVIGNLADEILQSNAGERTFFYVGDVKQAIYGWRGGDSTLFEAVQSYYKHLFGAKPAVLDVSWRSSPVVLNAVNTVFGANLSTPLDGYDHVISRWTRNWQQHQPAAKNSHLPGRVELYALDKPGKEETRALAPTIEMTCRIVEDLRRKQVPSIAVLVRLNSFGDEIADALRARRIDVRRETNPELLDNGAISALLSMLRFADHPGDDFAYNHVRMTGLFDVLRRWAEPRTDIADQPALLRLSIAARLRSEASVKGVAGLLGDVIDLCRAGGMLNDGFIGVRIRQLMDAAMEFDRTSRGGPSDFAAHACTLEVKDPVVSGGVVVMTIHKAKGLEFDAVILPDLQGRHREFTYLETGELVPFSDPHDRQSSGSNPADLNEDTEGWVFPFPGENLCRLDPVLTRFREQAQNSGIYGELCLLYVGMTRARQGLYLVTEEPPKSGGSLYASTVLQKTLGPGAGKPLDLGGLRGRLLFAEGDPDWFAKTGRKDKAAEKLLLAADFRPDAQAGAAAGRRLVITTPSGEETPHRLDASVLFGTGSREGANRGNALHELFEQMEWFEDGIGERVIKQGRPSSVVLPADVLKEVQEEFLRALESPEIRAALSRPSCPAELWREQAFELADQGRWITGRMDRVVVERDASGKPVSATVIDFKSDRVSTDQEIEERAGTYRPQVNWYVKALSRLLDLPQDRIRAILVFTYPRRTATVTAGTNQQPD